jgi:diacylglycerol kinase family enzyme
MSSGWTRRRLQAIIREQMAMGRLFLAAGGDGTISNVIRRS